MKILLVMPHPFRKKNFFSRLQEPSLTLQQIAGITPIEHNVTIIDERFEDIDFFKKYDVVGISCLTYNSLRGYEIARRFRQQNTPVVFGGYHATLCPNEVKQYADSVVIGEAELAWPILLRDLKYGQLKPFYQMRLPISEEIPPARHDIGRYNPFRECIQASRGCPTGCEFCAQSVVEGKVHRVRSIDAVIEEMKNIRSKTICFTDASLTINPTYSKKLFVATAEVNKKFECFGNINVLSDDDILLQCAKEGGVEKWYVGIESISQENIELSGKKTNKVENYKKAIRKIQDHDMSIGGLFMFGFDFDSQDIFDKTLQAIYDWGLDEVSFSIITPFPGTKLFKRLEKEGRITSYDWSRYTEGNLNIKLKNLSENQLKTGMKRIAFDYYSIRNSFKRSFLTKRLNPVDSLSKFLNALSHRSYYKHEKFFLDVRSE